MHLGSVARDDNYKQSSGDFEDEDNDEHNDGTDNTDMDKHHRRKRRNISEKVNY